MPLSQVDECGFCRIICRAAPARIVYEADNAVAFLPLAPAVPGHTLVVPKIHIRDIWALKESEAQSLATSTLAVCWAVRRALMPDGLNVINSNGQAATQTVNHLHVHVVPRWTGDAFGKIWPDSPVMSESEKDEIASLIRGAIAHNE